MIVLFLLFFACLKSTQDDAIKFNDKLIELQLRAFEIDDETDKYFYENIYSFHDTNDIEFKIFKRKFSRLYQNVLDSLSNISEVSDHTAMRQSLASIITYMKTGIDSLYTVLLCLDDENTAGNHVENYNRKFKALEKKFEFQQKKLAKEFNFKLEEKN